LELGLDELVSTVDRSIYPVEDYPYGQWSYMKFYETDFEKATAWYESDVRAALRAFRGIGDPATYQKPARTANVSQDGGWFGGIAKPDPRWREIPADKIVLDDATFDEFATGMEKTGFWGANAWYANHARNREYSHRDLPEDGYLKMPILCVHAKWDGVCATESNPKTCKASVTENHLSSTDHALGEKMRHYCKNLKEAVIEASHWVGEEKPAQTSAAISRWLVEECPEYWPVQWFGTSRL
jgi:soluble epoxide hydrolase / lipid-phosphate phosphatase